MEETRMKAWGWVLLAVMTAALAGCKDPAEGKPEARVGDAKGSGQVTPSEGSTTIALSGSNTTVEFTGSKVGGSGHDGGFRELTGKLVLAADGKSVEAVEAEIDLNSTWSDDERLTEHLKSKDFFEVATYPMSRFVSTGIKEGGADGATHSIEGDFTLHGVTNSITFPATIAVADGKVTLDSEFSIDRTKWNVNYKGLPADPIRDRVVIRLKIDTAR